MVQLLDSRDAVDAEMDLEISVGRLKGFVRRCLYSTLKSGRPKAENSLSEALKEYAVHLTEAVDSRSPNA